MTQEQMQADNIVYLHVLNWPKEGKICVNWIGASKAYLLRDAKQTPLPFTQASGQLIIDGPQVAPDPHVTVLMFEQDL